MACRIEAQMTQLPPAGEQVRVQKGVFVMTGYHVADVSGRGIIVLVNGQAVPRSKEGTIPTAQTSVVVSRRDVTKNPMGIDVP